MPRIITHPDVMHEPVPRVLVKNANWTEEEIQKIVDALSDKEYDIYVYHDGNNDIQWYEGIRTKAREVIDASQYSNQDPAIWLADFDKKFEV